MADFTDTEELDVFPTTKSHRPASSRRSQIKVADNGKVVNAANDGIRINEQKVDIAAAAKEVTMNDRSNRFVNSGANNNANNPINLVYINGGSQYDMSRPFPKDDPAAFTFNLMRNSRLPQISNRQPTWDETHETFADATELDRQRENIYTLWHDTKVIDAMRGVEAAIIKFRQHWELKDFSSENPPWTMVKENIRQAGSRARKCYKQPFLLQDQMVDRIRNINDFLTRDDDLQYFGWLDRLPEDKHRHCLAGPVRHILAAVVDCRPFNLYTVRSLESILSLFSESAEYVQLCRERRPTADMLTTTVDIFRQSAELLTTLLDYSRLKIRENGKKQIQSAIDRLGQTLADINRAAIAKLRGGGRVRRPREDEEISELLLYSRILNLCREVPAMYQAREAAYPTRRMSQIANDPRQRDLSTYPSSDARQSTTEDIINKKQVLDALLFRSEDNTKDINECLRYSEISGHERSQLAGLTREDAFQDWLKEDSQSTPLVIHGNLEDDENSPISYLAAQIGGKYRNKRGYIVLSWFCGLNTDENEPALMARLTGQLIWQATRLLPPTDFNFISRHEYKKLKQRNLNTLISVFSSTVQKLRSKRIVVFCLIDSISTYETRDKGRDTEKLVKALCDLTRSKRRRRQEEVKHELIFKLLLSDNQSSELAAKYFSKEDIIEMDDDVDTDVDSDASLVDSD